MSTIYPKQLDADPTAYGIATFNVANSIPFVKYGVLVYENVNYDTGTYDSTYNLSSWAPLSEFSYTYVQDANDTNKGIYLKVNCGIHTFEFREGEYQLGGLPLNILNTINNLNSSLGF